jgi:hypothetical protein
MTPLAVLISLKGVPEGKSGSIPSIAFATSFLTKDPLALLPRLPEAAAVAAIATSSQPKMFPDDLHPRAAIRLPSQLRNCLALSFSLSPYGH